MRPAAPRNASVAVFGPLVFSAVVALAQVGAAETTGVLTLTDTFQAGGERVIDVQMTLIAYFCATGVLLGALFGPTLGAHIVRSRNRDGSRDPGGSADRNGNLPRRLRRIPPVAAAVGALVPLALIGPRADGYVSGLGTDAVFAGAIVGAIAAFVLLPLVTWAAAGVSAHLALLWLVTLSLLPWVDPTIVYAGLVQPLGTSALDDLLGAVLGYHLPTLLPFAIAVVLLCGLLGARFVRRGATRGQSVLAAAAAPLLAAVLYPVVGTDLWNGEAAIVAAVVALVGAGTAAIGANIGRRTPAEPAERP